MNAHPTIRRHTTAATAAAALALCACLPAQANLLTDPGFDSQPLVPLTSVLPLLSTTPGVWGHENSTIVGITGAVTPLSPKYMLNMMNAGGVATQTMQAVDVSAGPVASLIATGTAKATMSAWFNTEHLPPANASVYLSFFSNANYGSLTGTVGQGLLVDSNPTTWQQASATATVPVGTTWMLAQVAYSNASIDQHSGFVDNASLTVTAVPEPSSYAMLGVGVLALGVLSRRRGAAHAA